ISESSHTGILISVDTDEPSESLSAPPFSVISIRPSGRNAMAVGKLRPPWKRVSSKPATGLPAPAGAPPVRGARTRRVRTRIHMGRLHNPPRLGWPDLFDTLRC